MRIEEVGVKSLAQAPTSELKTLRFRFMQVFDRYHGEGLASPILKMDWNEFVNRYLSLREEMHKRRLPLSGDPGIERFALKWLSERLGPTENLLVVKALSPAQQKEYDKETALIAENSKKPNAQKVHKFQPAKWTSKNGHPRCLQCGGEEPIGGICNKAEKAGDDRIPISKPETTETAQRIPVGEIPEGHKVRQMEISGKDGISALYDVTAKKIVTYIFDKDKFTMAEAKAWIKEHIEKAGTKPIPVYYVNPPDVEKPPELSPEDQAKKDEAELIDQNRQTQEAKMKHKFQPAKYQRLGDFKKRCLLCGDEEPQSGTCPGGSAGWEEREAAARAQPKGMLATVHKEMFFRIVKKDTAQQIVGGVVYEPKKVDSQGDWTDETEIQKTMYGFMLKYAEQPKRIKVMHKGKPYFFPVLECFQPEQDTKKGNDIIRKGAWWMMIKVTNEDVWADIESGAITGFSMGGMAREG